MALLKSRPARYSLARGFARNTDLASSELLDHQPTQWWQPEIDRQELKVLMKRQDLRPLLDYGLWLVLVLLSGYWAYAAWGSWWMVPAFFVYGTIYSSCDPRSHDLGHGATFRTPWLNEAFLRLTLFMTLKEPVLWRWRHARHHTDTIHAGRDPEIQVSRPADLLRIVADFFFIFLAWGEVKPVFLHAFGRITNDARHYVPESEWPKMIRSSRLMAGAIVAVILWCVVAGDPRPLLLLWGARFYGNWVNFLGYLTQHAGLKENASDHRQNTRTVLLDPVLTYLYNYLNYHIEHHLFPAVPYYNLPRLHALLRDQLPYTYRGFLAAHREIWPVLFRQAREADYFLVRSVPSAPRV